MPRYIGRPVICEAWQWTGHAHMLPESFRLALRSHRVGGIVEVMTADGVRQCKHEDWIVAGPDGTFSVQRAALFETFFEPFQPVSLSPAIPNPEPPAIPVKRSVNRKEAVHG